MFKSGFNPPEVELNCFLRGRSVADFLLSASWNYAAIGLVPPGLRPPAGRRELNHHDFSAVEGPRRPFEHFRS